MFTIDKPEVIIKKLNEYFVEQEFKAEENENKYQLKAHCETQDIDVLMKLRVDKVDENVRGVRIFRISGSKMDFLKLYKEIYDHLKEADMIV